MIPMFPCIALQHTAVDFPNICPIIASVCSTAILGNICPIIASVCKKRLELGGEATAVTDPPPVFIPPVLYVAITSKPLMQF